MDRIELKRKGVAFGLSPLNYEIYIHDPAYFLLRYTPYTFPGIVFKKDFANYGGSFYISATKHVNLNTKLNPCNEDPEYNFQHCVRTSLSKETGCRLPWTKWKAEDFPVCSNIERICQVSMGSMTTYPVWSCMM